MSTREMICICCPLGCRLEVAGDSDGNNEGNSGGNVTVTGNSCPKGEAYGIKELTNPTRTLTTTVRVGRRDAIVPVGHRGAVMPVEYRDAVVPVKTAGDIPKDKIMDCMAAIKSVVVEPPVQIGDLVLENVAGTGVNVVAAGNYKG